jgi:hypothetical protein
MELMTFMSNRDSWVAFPSVLQGLRLSRASAGEVLLFSRDPIADLGDITAFAAVFKVAGGAMDRLRIASPYPSTGWIGCLRAEGIRAVFFGPDCPDSCPRQLNRTSLIEVPQDLCPALHVRSFDGRAASVCGCRFDLLLLGRRQFTEECFARWAACRWMRAAGGASAANAREELSCMSSS